MAKRPPLIAGNWKMNLTLAGAKALAEAVVKGAADLPESKVVLAPPFTALGEVRKAIAGSPVQLAAQNVFWEDQGAFTGEVSAPLVRDAGCQYVVIGHSERRQIFGETDEGVNKKIKAALKSGLFPIFCLGETLAERERGETMDLLSRQLRTGLEGIAPGEFKSVVIAYEPVWAIGTGRTAAPGQAEEVHSHIRKKLELAYGIGPADCAIILYGGSVKPANSFALLSEKNIDGFLVGGASLEAESFVQIMREAIRAHKEKK